MALSYYDKHVFVCCNLREEGPRPCCANRGSVEVRDYAKRKIRELGLNGAGKVRINMAGCLDRCEEGPIMVVYPEEVWYSYLDEQDVNEIIEKHLIGGEPVDRLRI